MEMLDVGLRYKGILSYNGKITCKILQFSKGELKLTIEHITEIFEISVTLQDDSLWNVFCNDYLINTFNVQNALLWVE